MPKETTKQSMITNEESNKTKEDHFSWTKDVFVFNEIGQGKIYIEKVYDFYDLPLFFSAKRGNEYFLFHLIETTAEDGDIWYIFETSKKNIQDFENGLIDSYVCIKKSKNPCSIRTVWKETINCFEIMSKEKPDTKKLQELFQVLEKTKFCCN